MKFRYRNKITLTFQGEFGGQIGGSNGNETPVPIFTDIEQGWSLSEIKAFFTSQGANFAFVCLHTSYYAILWGIEHRTRSSWNEEAEDQWNWIDCLVAKKFLEEDREGKEFLEGILLQIL